MKKLVKKNYKIVVGLVIGILISATVVYASQTVLMGSEISYDNGTSHGTSNNVQGAIDELYKKITEQKNRMPKPSNENIISMYYYSEDKNSKDFCVTGDEETCKVNTCYLSNTKDICSPGTIVEYKVNDSDIIRFHVVHDDGETMTLQSQKNIGYNIPFDSTNGIDKGVKNILDNIENETKGWSNVNIFNYSIGDKDSTLGYSGCKNLECNSNSYTLDKKQVRARMITFQEAKDLGCNYQSCPIWLYNYLYNSTAYGGTADDYLADYAYFTMSIDNSVNILYHVRSGGYFSSYSINRNNDKNIYGVRAVVEIDK